MPVAANIATLIPTEPLTALAARISGGALSWYLLDINTGANVVIGSYTTPLGLSAAELREESIHVSEGGAPLVVARTAGDDVVAMTPSSSLAVPGFPAAFAEFTVNRYMRLFESGGNAYQYFYGETAEALPLDQVWGVSSDGRADSPTAIGSLAVVNSFGPRYLHGYHQAGYSSVSLLVDSASGGLVADGVPVVSSGFDAAFGASLSVGREVYCSYSNADAALVFYDVTDAPAGSPPDTVVQKDGITTSDGTPTMVWAWLCDRYPDSWDESPPTIGGGGFGS